MGKQNCNAKKDRQCNGPLNGQQKQEKTQQTMIRTWKQKKQKMIHRKLKDGATQTLLKNEYIFDKYIKISVFVLLYDRKNMTTQMVTLTKKGILGMHHVHNQ
jgi:hypothetical protein